MEFPYLINFALKTTFQGVVIHIFVDFCSAEIEFIQIFGHMAKLCTVHEIVKYRIGTLSYATLYQQNVKYGEIRWLCFS